MREQAFLTQIVRNRANAEILTRLPGLGIPQAFVVAGCLFQTIWNIRSGRAPHADIKDYDIFYFDDSDLSWEAEDEVIRRGGVLFGDLDGLIEIRNQARVHLWYPDKHGLPYPPLTRSTDGIDRFLTQNTQVGVRRSGEGYEVYAPHGFDDIAGLIARPNPGANFSAANYAAKVSRWKALWPEINVIAAE